MLERLAEVNSEKVKILKVDVRSERKWAAEENIRGIPAFQIYSGGKKVKEFKGAPPEENLQQMIDQYSSQAVASSASDAPAEPAIKPMPKDWLPPGITRKKESETAPTQ